ncbi:MAG: ATP-binding protein [Desulfobulbus sp.]|nr:ATP-binding protein [Desulfobulbus sp.]
MTDMILQLTDNDVIGTIAGVDTSRVTVSVSNPHIVSRLGIGNLVAIKGGTESVYLIAMIERVVRGLIESTEVVDPDSDLIPMSVCPGDIVRVVLIGTFRTIDGERKNQFKRGADAFPQIDQKCCLLEGGNLQRFMGLLGADFDETEKLRLGTFVADHTAAAIASGDKLFQRHAAILGSTGSGKSWAVALLLERAAKLKHPNIIVFDMHGEYGPLSDPAKGGYATRFKIAGSGDLNRTDPETVFLPYWALNRDELLSMLLDRSDQNAPNQASRFTLHVRNLKGEVAETSGTPEVKACFTVDSPIPFPLEKLISLLNTDDTEKGVGKGGAPVKGEWEGKLTRFLSRLDAKISDRRYGFMFQPPAISLGYGWFQEFAKNFFMAEGGSGIKIIDFSEVPSDVLPIVTGVFARLLYDIQFWMQPAKRRPISIFCDEAHLYLPTKDTADAVERQALWNFERIAKEGRKYGFGLVVISQRPSDVSRTILSQCNNFITLRLTNDIDQNVVKRLVPDNLSQIVDVLPLLDVGEALVLGDAVLLPTRVKLDEPSIQPESATRNFWREWNDSGADTDAAKDAVEAMRAQTRLTV